MADSSDKKLIRVKFQEKAERFDEMVESIKVLVKDSPEVLEQQGELELVSVAFKNAVGERRASWRVARDLLEEADSQDKKEVAKEIMDRLETEITTLCANLQDLVTGHLLDVAKTPETKVLLLKLKGDYARYMTEIQSGDERKESIGNADTAYSAAMELAEAEVNAAHPNKLGLVLNMSLYHCVVLNDVDTACEIVIKGIEDAEPKLNDLDETNRAESTRLMQIIQSNVQTWKNNS